VFKGDASPVWRGIEHGLDLLKQEIIWCIGNGTSMRIWRDNWLPRNIGLKITSKRKSLRLIKVKSLVGPDQKWNEDLMKKTFSPHDAEQILGKKLPRKPCNDFAA
jgi:hypothetical protein